MPFFSSFTAPSRDDRHASASSSRSRAPSHSRRPSSSSSRTLIDSHASSRHSRNEYSAHYERDVYSARPERDVYGAHSASSSRTARQADYARGGPPVAYRELRELQRRSSTSSRRSFTASAGSEAGSEAGSVSVSGSVRSSLRHAFSLRLRANGPIDLRIKFRSGGGGVSAADSHAESSAAASRPASSHGGGGRLSRSGSVSSVTSAAPSLPAITRRGSARRAEPDGYYLNVVPSGRCTPAPSDRYPLGAAPSRAGSAAGYAPAGYALAGRSRSGSTSRPTRPDDNYINAANALVRRLSSRRGSTTSSRQLSGQSFQHRAPRF